MPIFRIMGGAPGSPPPPDGITNNTAVYPGNRGQQQSRSQQQQRSTFTYPGQMANRPSHVVHGQSNNMVPSRAGNVAGGGPVVICGTQVQNAPHSHYHSSVAGPASNHMSNSNSNTGNNISSASSDTTRPGAYSVSRTSSQVFRVTVPAGVRPGSEFSVHAGSRRVRVRCPPTSRPGQSLQITLPPEPVTQSTMLKIAPLTAPTGETGGGGSVAMNAEVEQVNRAAADSGGTAQTFLVTIPPNVYPGMQFTVSLDGQRFMVTCPNNAVPNMRVGIVPPTQREEPMAAPKTQVFEVVVPPGVRPGQPFTLMANEQPILVTCPPNVVSGQKVRFQLPVQQIVGNIKLSYEGNSWSRTIRVSDLKFQWVRVENDQVVQEDGVNFNRSAYVRKLILMEGNDARMRTGVSDMVPAQEAVVDSKLVINGKTLLSYADIANVQGKTLEEKTTWFQGLCSQITGNWEDGHIKVVVRRSQLLQDSVDSVMSLGRDDMRKRWRFEFMGEQGIDEGGLTREWFQLVSQEIFDPDNGLWLSSNENQMCMTINPASNISRPDDHLIYFRFLGRVMGRALFDRQLIKGHMVRHIYKHVLGWPVSFKDLELDDEGYYQSLKKLANMDDVSMMCLDFTTTEERLGVHTEVDLVEGGALKEVTNDNVAEYLEANLKYRLLGRTKPQLTELLLGFFDVVPEPALTVFDPNELELMLCGLPTIDIDDWQANTIYSGLFETKGAAHQVVHWFWDAMRNDFDQEMKARLLQFVTGTSGVPSRGFSVLQGNDGNIKKFTIHGVSQANYPFPRAHTCFNRIDLPMFQSKKELVEKLRIAVTSAAIGFGLE